MKNLPARERSTHRVHGKYAMHNKIAYIYPNFKKQSISLATLQELHTARVVAFGLGYNREDKDLERIERAAHRSVSPAV